MATEELLSKLVEALMVSSSDENKGTEHVQLSDSECSLSDRECEETYRRAVKGKNPDPRRWWVLAIYGCAAFNQTMIWNTWSPIASSAIYAYPSWHPSVIALLNNWGCITFLLFIVPCCSFLNSRGLKPSFILAAFLSTLGSGIRLIPVDENVFTVLVHFGAILNSIGGVALSPAILLLSSTWFPPHQRTTSTGVGTAMCLLGIAGSYVLGPNIVSEPPDVPQLDEETLYYRNTMRAEISLLCFIGFITELILLLIIIFLFPERPSQPPSRSSILKTVHAGEPMRTSFQDLLRKKNFWLLALSAALCSGITGPWLSLLTIVFAHTGITQSESAGLGFWTIICSCCMSLSVSKVSDYCPRRIRYILISLVFVADIMFVWILLMTLQIIPFRKESLAVTVITGLSLVWAAPPLFYEFGAEITYPIPEGIVGGTMMALNNAVACFVYLQIYIFPYTNVDWMNYALTIFAVMSLLLLFCVKDEYNRLDVDRDNRPLSGNVAFLGVG